MIPAPTNAQQFRDLRERRIDLVLGRMTPPIEEDIHVEILFHDRAVVVAGPNSKWTGRRKLELSELSDEPWYLPLPDTPIGCMSPMHSVRAAMKFPPKGVAWGAASLVCALLPRGPFLGYFAGLAVAVRRQSTAAQGPAGGPAGSIVAGRSHDAEESHAYARGAALHRLRARGREAVGEQERDHRFHDTDRIQRSSFRDGA